MPRKINTTAFISATRARELLATGGITLTKSSFHTYISRGTLRVRRKPDPYNKSATLYHRGDLLKAINERETRYKQDGYVNLTELFEHDRKLRRRHTLPPRENHASLLVFLYNHRTEIRTHKLHASKKLYHLDDALDALTDLYTTPRRAEHARANTNHSCAASHLEATPAILANQDYQPIEFFKACGIPTSRISNLTSKLIIIPYWDPATKRLLYPVDQIITRLQHHTLKAIRTRCGAKYAQHIAATRPYITWGSPVGTCKAYYTPELAHCKLAHL